ncbi:hypothetical protein J6590_017488 [Homalodisca vitripennis]|nr:hypothetical protein J6590_017488 [Homalodisca vitripennis]
MNLQPPDRSTEMLIPCLGSFWKIIPMAAEQIALLAHGELLCCSADEEESCRLPGRQEGKNWMNDETVAGGFPKVGADDSGRFVGQGAVQHYSQIFGFSSAP